jgi:acyl-CoA dehydrogenase
MNFDFSEDQRRLQEEVARVLAAQSTSTEVRTVLDGAQPYSRPCWTAMAELGVLGVALPEAHGGVGLGPLELCLMAEEAGRALLAAPLRSSIYLAAEAIRRGGSAAQQASWLPRLACGEVIATAAVTPARHHVLPADPLRFANGTLSGTIHAVPDGMVADLVVVLAGDTLVLVETGAAGVTRTAQRSLDPTCPVASLTFADTPAEALPGDGPAIARTVTHGAAVLLAFEQVGGADKALHAARDYVLERRAFGRIVGGYQAVKHKLAELYSQIELARAHAYYGAWALASDAPELPRAAAAARVAATMAYNITAEESLHLHGGIGFTWEMDCHLHLRRARWLGQIIGNVHLWRDELAAALIEEAA